MRIRYVHPQAESLKNTQSYRSCLAFAKSQDKKDDILVNVKSTALRFGDHSRTVLTGLGASFVSLLTYAGYASGAGPLYYLISCLGAASHLTWQLRTVNFEDRADCWAKFVSNGRLGGLVWVGMFADYLAQMFGWLA
jgi:4-hydroxybenzoate polyprenyltransferase